MHPTGLSLLLLMQSAGATVNIIGVPVTSPWVVVKTAFTWVRSLCSRPSEPLRPLFFPINFVSFHVTLKALLLPPGVKALPSSCGSATSTSFNHINHTKKWGDDQKEKKKVKRKGHTTTLHRGVYVLHSWTGGADVMLLTNLICWIFSKQTPFNLEATIQRKCSHWGSSGNSLLLPFISHSWQSHQRRAKQVQQVLCELKESQGSGVADGCSTTSTHQTTLKVP